MPQSLSDVFIPDEMAEEIDRLVRDPALGFGMREDFILEAIRKSLIWYGGVR